MSVITGVSGSGKSSLAFDTLYAESQRRYVASLSTYARQFLERLPRPPVDRISQLPPAIAIEQRNRVSNARSTVGTVSEIDDHLRLLFAKVGKQHCPDCKCQVQDHSVRSVSQAILQQYPGQGVSLAITFPEKRESAKEEQARWLQLGFSRLLTGDGERLELADLGLRRFSQLRKSGLLLVDRLRVREAETARLAEAVSLAFQQGGGELVVQDQNGERIRYLEGARCDGCGRSFPPLEPSLFSFHHGRGACSECSGFGRNPCLDLARVIPDPSRSIAEKTIAPFATPAGAEMQEDLLRACRHHRIPLRTPYQELSDQQQDVIVEGDSEDWYGIRGYFDWLEERRYKLSARIQIARYRRFDPCEACGGSRLCPEARSVELAGLRFPELQGWSIETLKQWFADASVEAQIGAHGEMLLGVLRRKLETACEVGIGYLSPARAARTLSGGEAQRLQLATALGGALTASLYVLDEPSVGLHARDIQRLLGVLFRIRDHGNTVVVVEHASEIIEAADHIIELGPAAGRHGGSLIMQGSVKELRKHSDSATAKALRGEIKLAEWGPKQLRARFDPKTCLGVRGASAQNLKNIDVDFPLHQLCVVSGVSGAGKSTLVRSVLVGQLQNDPERGACRELQGKDQIQEVIMVEPTPPGRSTRSNPATLSKAFDELRRLLAATPEAKAQGLAPGWFSFNTRGGRCESCEGSGETLVDMHFLEDLRVPCDACSGSRYQSRARNILLRGQNVVELLNSSIDEVLELFHDVPQIQNRLLPFSRVGLGYLALGQSTASLSGGEAQRLRIALALSQRAEGRLFVLDEPTTGLHPSDILHLLSCLRALLEEGASVIVIEHNLDFIRAADHVIELGPEGGPGGGEVIAVGSLREVKRVPDSLTAAALRGDFHV